MTLIDPDGHKGAGVVHMIAYNFPPSVTSLPEGRPATGGTPGQTSEAAGYSGYPGNGSAAPASGPTFTPTFTPNGIPNGGGYGPGTRRHGQLVRRRRAALPR